MENYNINRNKKPLTDADIAKGQNFDGFMKAYGAKKPSFFKTPKFYALAAVTGAIIIAGTWMLVNSTETVAETTPQFIAPLFAGAEDPDTTFTVNAGEGGTLVNTNGSMIYIPGSAFLDSNNKIVSGQVELRYKEFHDVAKIFMAGIPMTYDSAGNAWNFESAGMIEITAWQNGKPLKTNPDSLIHVAMVSNSAEERYNTYYLDTAAKQWKYVNDEKALTFAPPAVDSTPGVTLPAVLPDAPVAPRVADKNKPSFAIAFDAKEFPELTAYKGVRFEVDESQTPYNKEDKKVAWEDVTIHRIKDKDEFRVKFTAGTREAEYVTHPVVDGKDYEAAKASWEKRNADYLKLKEQREANEKKETEAQQVLMEQREKHRVWMNDSLANVVRDRRIAASLQSTTQDLVMREFIISDFGIWNADCPESLPDGMEIFVKATDQNGAPLDAGKYYLVEKGKNALYMYISANLPHFGYNPDAENMIWAITKDGRLATVSVDDFKNATAGDKKEVTFKFTVGAEKLKDADEARRVLDIPPPVGM